MPKREWTAKQKQSITATGGSVLISAAAGSGKTAVLVERIIRRITDRENPVDVDRLLVVTFTRAAAAEMRQRLSSALAEKIAEDPENLLYQRQQLLLPHAHISTIHGFCSRLLRDYASEAGLPVGFQVAEDAQAKLLAAEAMETVLEQSFRRRDPAFLALADQLNSHRDDSGLREAVGQAYTFMQAQPFPDRWLQQQVDAYTQIMPMEKTPWMQPILQELAFRLEGICLCMDKALANTYGEGTEAYLDIIPAECKRLHQMKDDLFSFTYDQLFDCLNGFVFERLPAIRAKDAAAQERKLLVQAFRDEAKKRLKKAVELLPCTEAECREDLTAMAPLVEALGELVKAYTQQYKTLKRQQKLLDYNDLEHETLRLLLDEATGQPTPLARELSARFAEIMVDEYQDTNGAQDALFCALSREQSNLFMVGDVKQSIYGFRQAMPEIFTTRRDSYQPYQESTPTYPALITMENNFRSRKEVTDSVNFLFRQLMQPGLGGVEYAGGEELVCSARYPAGGDYRTQWLLLDRQQGDDGQKSAVSESRVVARHIRQLMTSMQVRDGEGTRPLQWQDVCILFRGRKAMTTYAKTFTELGIPVATEAAAGLLDAAEIRVMLSLLRVIDNPLREVELAAVMLSPLYGFTPDDLAKLRLAGGKRTPLYVAMGQYSHPAADREESLTSRCAQLLGDLRRYRALAVSLPADRLLEYIYRESAVLAVYAAQKGGRQRVANLRELDRIARGFEQGGFRGLSAFVRYADRLEEQGHTLLAGGMQHRDGVRLMTVHASKGLEFPVVYLACLSRRGNDDDGRKKVLFHEKTGIGLQLRDWEAQEKHTTLPFQGVRCARRLDETAEELRVWYVAMTRAGERLIPVYTAKDLERDLAARSKDVPPAGPILPEVLLRAATPGDMLLTAALRHPDFLPLRPEPCNSLPAECGWEVTVCAATAETDPVAQLPETVTADEALTAALRQRLTYQYPYEALLGIPAKLAASQLSHEAMSRENIAVARPAFLQKEGLTPAQKGTALHTFMQYADLTLAAQDLPAEIQRLLAAGFLTEAQSKALPEDKIRRFLTGDLYRRMTAAQQVWREYPFTVPVAAGTLTQLPEGLTDETVVVQGIADCVFREGDALVLVDYKTDRVKTPEELVDRYRSQMLFYRQALESLLGLPVKEMLLYSFKLDTPVLVE